MKVVIFWWVVGVSLALEDLIIERRPHHLDWDDLFMEYDRFFAPNHESQKINITLDFIVIKPGTLIFEMTQKWKDERLRFAGDSSFSVPKQYSTWMPDTYIRNGMNEIISKSSLRLKYDGTLQYRQKYQISNDLMSDALQIASFDNYGAEKIIYVLENSTSSQSEYPIQITSDIFARDLDGQQFHDLIIHLNNTIA